MQNAVPHRVDWRAYVSQEERIAVGSLVAAKLEAAYTGVVDPVTITQKASEFEVRTFQAAGSKEDYLLRVATKVMVNIEQKRFRNQLGSMPVLVVPAKQEKSSTVDAPSPPSQMAGFVPKLAQSAKWNQQQTQAQTSNLVQTQTQPPSLMQQQTQGPVIPSLQINTVITHGQTNGSQTPRDSNMKNAFIPMQDASNPCVNTTPGQQVQSVQMQIAVPSYQPHAVVTTGQQPPGVPVLSIPQRNPMMVKQQGVVGSVKNAFQTQGDHRSDLQQSSIDRFSRKIAKDSSASQLDSYKHSNINPLQTGTVAQSNENNQLQASTLHGVNELAQKRTESELHQSQQGVLRRALVDQLKSRQRIFPRTIPTRSNQELGGNSASQAQKGGRREKTTVLKEGQNDVSHSPRTTHRPIYPISTNKLSPGTINAAATMHASKQNLFLSQVHEAGDRPNVGHNNGKFSTTDTSGLASQKPTEVTPQRGVKRKSEPLVQKDSIARKSSRQKLSGGPSRQTHGQTPSAQNDYAGSEELTNPQLLREQNELLETLDRETAVYLLRLNKMYFDRFRLLLPIIAQLQRKQPEIMRQRMKMILIQSYYTLSMRKDRTSKYKLSKQYLTRLDVFLQRICRVYGEQLDRVTSYRHAARASSSVEYETVRVPSTRPIPRPAQPPNPATCKPSSSEGHGLWQCSPTAMKRRASAPPNPQKLKVMENELPLLMQERNRIEGNGRVQESKNNNHAIIQRTFEEREQAVSASEVDDKAVLLRESATKCLQPKANATGPSSKAVCVAASNGTAWEHAEKHAIQVRTMGAQSHTRKELIPEASKGEDRQHIQRSGHDVVEPKQIIETATSLNTVPVRHKDDNPSTPDVREESSREGERKISEEGRRDEAQKLEKTEQVTEPAINGKDVHSVKDSSQGEGSTARALDQMAIEREGGKCVRDRKLQLFLAEKDNCPPSKIFARHGFQNGSTKVPVGSIRNVHHNRCSEHKSSSKRMGKKDIYKLVVEECGSLSERYTSMEISVADCFGLPEVSCEYQTKLMKLPKMVLRVEREYPKVGGVTIQFTRPPMGWVSCMSKIKDIFYASVSENPHAGVTELVDMWVKATRV